MARSRARGSRDRAGARARARLKGLIVLQKFICIFSFSPEFSPR